ncbi:MAG: glutathione S-transferase N-terminal domain-containing protein [Candidatus Eremiobacteraeota bacterium]|nr:glutathione S-transferase N-terminal domain-containing protein [Candidatus Eremiobacteraeota bacterium]
MDPTHVRPGQKIEMYIKQNCPYCREARQFYDQRGIPYTVYDAQNDRDARRRMFDLSGNDPTVPAIVIDGTYVQSGWGRPRQG